jgi:hypothetical protein
LFLKERAVACVFIRINIKIIFESAAAKPTRHAPFSTPPRDTARAPYNKKEKIMPIFDTIGAGSGAPPLPCGCAAPFAASET